MVLERVVNPVAAAVNGDCLRVIMNAKNHLATGRRLHILRQEGRKTGKLYHAPALFVCSIIPSDLQQNTPTSRIYTSLFKTA
jgi:hypothetical protein